MPASEHASNRARTEAATLTGVLRVMTTSHASIQQTQRYLNVTDKELRRGLEVSWRNQGRPLRLASSS